MCEQTGLGVYIVCYLRIIQCVCGGKGKDKPFPPKGCVLYTAQVRLGCVDSSVSKCVSLKTAILYIVLGTISNDYLDQSVGRLVYLCDLSRRFASRGLPNITI